VLAGLELLGIPVVKALSLATGLPASFARNEPTYGTARLAEGADIEGRRVFVIEDVITTGGQVARSTSDLRDRGADVDTALCLIDCSGGNHNHAELDAISLQVRSVVTTTDLGG
jgi:orotate phosphoribosyltransferase